MKNNGDLRVIGINKSLEVQSYPFKRLFTGFDKVAAVQRLFGAGAGRVLAEQRVRVYDNGWTGYLHVDSKTGAIDCNMHYLRTGDKRHVYLDVIHELVHIKQRMNGRELFDERYDYVDRPTEIEAYRVSVEEARRLGMSEKEIVEYLRVDDWITKEEFRRLLKSVGVKG